MPCNCKKFAPKGKPPKGKGAAKPKNLRVNTNAANQAVGYATKYGVKVKVPKVTATKGKAPKVSARVAYYQKREAARLKKANANPCKCTPGKP